MAEQTRIASMVQHVKTHISLLPLTADNTPIALSPPCDCYALKAVIDDQLFPNMKKPPERPSGHAACILLEYFSSSATAAETQRLYTIKIHQDVFDDDGGHQTLICPVNPAGILINLPYEA